MVEGTVTRQTGYGPFAAYFVIVHITPEELARHGLDREQRHREQGMDRHVWRRWIERESP